MYMTFEVDPSENEPGRSLGPGYICLLDFGSKTMC